MIRSLFALFALSLIGCGDAVVDGACAAGYERSDHGCRAVVSTETSTDAGAFPDADAPGCEADVNVDPNNCGFCGNVCVTGICNGGVCMGAAPGHIVVAGHDYAVGAPGLAISRVLVNAVFLPHRNPVRVVTFERWANPASVATAQYNLDQSAALSGRTYHRTVATSASELRDSLQIEKFDVALIHDQSQAPAGALAQLGEELRATLESFVRVGGVVVALDGGTGTGEMPSFLTSSGLLGVASHEVNTANRVNVVAPADAVAIGVMTPYSAAHNSVTFTLSELATPSLVTVVVEPKSERPVVLHKVVFR